MAKKHARTQSYREKTHDLMVTLTYVLLFAVIAGTLWLIFVNATALDKAFGTR